MHQLLEHLEQPNPECKNCEGKGMFGDTPDMCCPVCWRFGWQHVTPVTDRNHVLLIACVLFRVLERRHSCPGCGGSGMLEGLNKCPCSADADAALKNLVGEIERCNQEALWLSGEKSMDDLIEEMLGV